MLIIADKRIPKEAKTNLQKFGKLVLLETKGITEESISGHPDIFFCKTTSKLIVAPNLPDNFKKVLSDNHIIFIEGAKTVGNDYPFAARYNAVITENYLIHKTDITESAILSDCKELQQIQVRQGFTRCSLLPLKENNFITSDEGVFKTLVAEGLHALLVSADEILLPGHTHGFFGGACGIIENKIFVLGNLSYYGDAKKVRLFVSPLGYEILELYDGPLFDGGSLFFIP